MGGGPTSTCRHIDSLGDRKTIAIFIFLTGLSPSPMISPNIYLLVMFVLAVSPARTTNAPLSEDSGRGTLWEPLKVRGFGRR